jgi:hypothetical protein
LLLIKKSFNITTLVITGFVVNNPPLLIIDKTPIDPDSMECSILYSSQIPFTPGLLVAVVEYPLAAWVLTGAVDRHLYPTDGLIEFFSPQTQLCQAPSPAGSPLLSSRNRPGSGPLSGDMGEHLMDHTTDMACRFTNPDKLRSLSPAWSTAWRKGYCWPGGWGSPGRINGPEEFGSMWRCFPIP